MKMFVSFFFIFFYVSHNLVKILIFVYSKIISDRSLALCKNYPTLMSALLKNPALYYFGCLTHKSVTFARSHFGQGYSYKHGYLSESQ